MKIAVASGKGGTGKTLLSVALTKAIAGSVTLLDCDVEAPNCHLFFPNDSMQATEVTQLIPVVDADLCDSCGKCADFCQFNAIICLDEQPAMVFDELCHSCGGCEIVCPTGAINEQKVGIGALEFTPISAEKELITGRLNIGYSMSPAIILAVNREPILSDMVIIDAPPGTSCPFVATVSEADFTILITEPTPFGRHDLQLAVETMREIGKPFAVVINRSEQPINIISTYCTQQLIPVLLQIPASRHIAQCYSQGLSLLDADPSMEDRLINMVKQIKMRIDQQ